jgi:hypothetical protein
MFLSFLNQLYVLIICAYLTTFALTLSMCNLCLIHPAR